MLVEIYGRPGCAFCTAAKNLCAANDIEHRYYDIAADATKGTEMMERVQKATGQQPRSVPQIFVDDILLQGGFDELRRMEF